MVARTSAGILLHRRSDRGPEVLIGHMGGPFWARKDEGGWSIPKGEFGAEEDPLLAAQREFREEMGCSVPASDFVDLGSRRQSAGKIVFVWAAEGDLDADATVSNTFELEWPRGSGTIRSYPEIDRAAWVDIGSARTKLVKGQVPFLDELLQHLNDLPASDAGR